MGRIFTDERRDAIFAAHEAHPDDIGPALGALVVTGNVPVETVSQLLAVTRPTIYRWMHGISQPRDPDKIKKLNRLLGVLRQAQSAGLLPLSGSSGERTDALIRLISARASAKA